MKISDLKTLLDSLAKIGGDADVLIEYYDSGDGERHTIEITEAQLHLELKESAVNVVVLL